MMHVRTGRGIAIPIIHDNLIERSKLPLTSFGPAADRFLRNIVCLQSRFDGPDIVRPSAAVQKSATFLRRVWIADF
jgi:hypothetical protein